MDKSHDPESRSNGAVSDQHMGRFKAFIQDRPLLAVALSLLAGAFLARHLCKERRDATK